MNPLLEEMKPLSLKLGIKEEYFNAYTLQPDEEWLYRLYNNEWRDVVQARNLVSEETWANYQLLRVFGLAEQLLLEQAVSKLRKVWRKRYAIVHKKATEQGTEQKSVHPKSKRGSKHPKSDS